MTPIFFRKPPQVISTTQVTHILETLTFVFRFFNVLLLIAIVMADPSNSSMLRDVSTSLGTEPEPNITFSTVNKVDYGLEKFTHNCKLS